MAKWLDKYNDGGPIQENYNDAKASTGPGYVGIGYDTTGRNYSPAWGGQFQMGGALPGATGMMYARTQDPAPSNGKYAKKTKASAQNGKRLPDVVVTSKADPRFKAYQDSLALYNASIAMGKKSAEALAKDYYKKDLEYIKMAKDYDENKEQHNKFAKSRYKDNLDFYNKTLVDPITKGTKPKFGGLYKYDKDADDRIVIEEDILNKGMHNYLTDNDRIEKGYYKQTLDSYKGFKKLNKNIKPVKYLRNAELFPIPVYKKPVQPVKYQKPEPAPVVEKQPIPKQPTSQPKPLYEYEGESVMVQTPGGGGGAMVGVRKKDGTVEYIRPEDYQRMGVPKYGQDYIKSKQKMQNGGEMKFYQEGLDFKPKSISKNGSVIKDDRGQWAHPGEITEIGSNDITMQGVNYPVLGISDTGDTKMMYPDQDYKFDGKKVTEYPMAQDGDWLKKFATEPMRQDATRNVIPRKMTEKERLEAAANSDQAQKRALVNAKDVIAERKKNKATKGDINTPGSWHTEDKLRMFPNSPGGLGEVIDEYINPGTYVGVLADALGESVAARDPKAVAMSLGLAAGTGLLGFDPLGSAIKGVKSLKSTDKLLKGYKEVPKPTSTSRRLTDKEIQEYNQKLYLDRRKGLGNQGPTDAPPEGLMPFASPEYKEGGWLNKYK